MINFKKAPFFGSELELIPMNGDGERSYVAYLGGVQAGFPSPAEDTINKKISLDERYLSKSETTFLVKVRSLSMYPEYRIGDLLVVRSDLNPSNHDDIIVSINSQEYTLKRYDKENASLLSLNPDYDHCIQINESDEVLVLGIVVALIRDRKKM